MINHVTMILKKITRKRIRLLKRKCCTKLCIIGTQVSKNCRIRTINFPKLETHELPGHYYYTHCAQFRKSRENNAPAYWNQLPVQLIRHASSPLPSPLRSSFRSVDRWIAITPSMSSIQCPCSIRNSLTIHTLWAIGEWWARNKPIHSVFLTVDRYLSLSPSVYLLMLDVDQIVKLSRLSSANDGEPKRQQHWII